MSENTAPCTLGRSPFPFIPYAPIIGYRWQGFWLPAWAVERALESTTERKLAEMILAEGEPVREPDWNELA